jgi:UDP-N-acetylmuramate dehydrogenase
MLAKNVSLQPYNTFGIAAKAATFATFKSLEELDKILNNRGSTPLLILGGGSNILFTAEMINSLVLVNQIKGISLIKETPNNVFVKVGAGENWHEFVRYAIARDWGGIENLSLIPGSVGASPMQNIGAYGVEIKDVFDSLEAYEIASGKLHTFSHEACAFGYRESVFKHTLKDQFVIVSVTYRLSKKQHAINTSYGIIDDQLKEMGVTHPSIEDVSNAVIAIRQSKLPDPKEIGNAGSFFKNPVIPAEHYASLLEQFPDMPHYKVNQTHVKVPAGWLIDQAGWKGKTLGHYGVHKKQALVLVNYDGATGSEIYALSEMILQDINKRYGILLEREVNIVG